MDSIKRQNYMTLEDECPRLEGVECTTGKNGRQLVTASVRMKWLGQSENDILVGNLISRVGRVPWTVVCFWVSSQLPLLPKVIM